MMRINLLPFRAARRKENIRRQISIFALGFILLTIVMFWFHLHLNGKINELTIVASTKKKELKTLKKAAKEVDSIKKALDLLQKKINVINTLEKNRKEPIRLLDTMTTMVVPKRMWLTSLGAKGGTVRLNGIALDNKTVADFMVRLEGSGLFSNVKLITLKKQRIQTLNVKSFEIVCQKATPKEAAKGKG